MGRALPRFLHDYRIVLIEMIPFACILTQDSPLPHPREHIALAWVQPAGFEAYDLAPADLPVIAHLRATAYSRP